MIHAFIIALLFGDVRAHHLPARPLLRHDQTFLNANLWSTFLGYGEASMRISMILGDLILFAGIGVFVEGWREPHRTRQDNRFVTDRLEAGDTES